MEVVLKIEWDGDKVCALYGDDLQDGIAGFGDSIPDALSQLAEEWRATRGDEKP